MLAIPVAVILGAVDINDTRGYYHCSNGPKYARGYNDLSLIAIVAFCSSDCSCEIKCHPDLNGTSTLGAILILSSANIITYIKTLGLIAQPSQPCRIFPFGRLNSCGSDLHIVLLCVRRPIICC
jgi:hypothetical protein